MALDKQTLSQIHELQATVARDEGILLVALPVKAACALMDAVNFTAARVPDNDLHIHDMQAGSGLILNGLKATGLIDR